MDMMETCMCKLDWDISVNGMKTRGFPVRHVAFKVTSSKIDMYEKAYSDNQHILPLRLLDF